MHMNQACRIHVRTNSRMSRLRFIGTAPCTQARIRRNSDCINDVCDLCRAGNHNVACYFGNSYRAAGNRRSGNVRTAHRDSYCAKLFIRAGRRERRSVGRTLGNAVRRVGRCAVGEILRDGVSHRRCRCRRSDRDCSCYLGNVDCTTAGRISRGCNVYATHFYHNGGQRLAAFRRDGRGVCLAVIHLRRGVADRAACEIFGDRLIPVQRLGRSIGHSRAISVDIGHRQSARSHGKMYAFVTKTVTGNRVDGVDESHPLWFISASGKGVRPRTGIKCSKLIVLVDVRLAHAEQPFKYTSQCAGSVCACRAMEIHRLPVRYCINHAPEVSLPGLDRGQRVGRCLVGNRKPYIAAKRGFRCNVTVRRIASLFASEIDLMLHSELAD